MNHERHIPYANWVVPGKFPAGEYPCDRDRASSFAMLKALTDTGVTAFVDITERDEP